MAEHGTLKHGFVSTKPQSTDGTIVSTNQWNQQHIFSGGSVGQYLRYNAGQSDSIDWAVPLGYIDVSLYATAGLGTALNPWTGWDGAITWAAGVTYFFPAGYYSYTSALQWGVVGSRYVGAGWRNTILHHAGSGNAVNLNGGSAGPGIHNITVQDMTISGNTNTTDIVFMQSCHHSTMRQVRLYSCGSACLRLQWCVLNTYDNIAISFNEVIFAPPPQDGIVLDKRTSDNLPSSANIFINPIIEGVSRYGIAMLACINNTIIGGTSESNGSTGIYMSVDAVNNTIMTTDVEANTSNDIVCAGSSNSFIGVFGGTTFRAVSGSKGNTIIGGVYTDIVIDSGAVSISIIGAHSYHALADNTDGSCIINTNGLYYINGNFFETDRTKSMAFVAGRKALLQYKTFEETVTIAASTGTFASSTLPQGAILLAISVRVTVAIPTAATFIVSFNTTGTPQISVGSVSTAINSTNPGTLNCPICQDTTDGRIVFIPNVTPANNNGRVRIQVQYLDPTVQQS